MELFFNHWRYSINTRKYCFICSIHEKYHDAYFTDLATIQRDYFYLLAGAQRIFDLLDEQPEEDDGTIELVNIEKDSDGRIHESRNSDWGLGLERRTTRYGTLY